MIPEGEFPLADTSLHSVPLSDILFDTFGGSPRFLPLDRAKESRILDLRDAIVPILHPVYGAVDALSWLRDDNLVMGYVSEDDAYAYPINVLNMHEIVNDVINGVPVLITYCPLCFSGVVYHRELDGTLLTFGNTSALYQSDLVMYDHQTGSYWFQVGGEAVVGELTGSHLNLLPVPRLFDQRHQIRHRDLIERNQSRVFPSRMPPRVIERPQPGPENLRIVRPDSSCRQF